MSSEDEFFDAPEALGCNLASRWSDNEDDLSREVYDFEVQNARRKKRVESLKKSIVDKSASTGNSSNFYRLHQEEAIRKPVKSSNVGYSVKKALSKTDPCVNIDNVRYQAFENIHDQTNNGCVYSYPKLNYDDCSHDYLMNYPCNLGDEDDDLDSKISSCNFILPTFQSQISPDKFDSSTSVEVESWSVDVAKTNTNENPLICGNMDALAFESTFSSPGLSLLPQLTTPPPRLNFFLDNDCSTDTSCFSSNSPSSMLQTDTTRPSAVNTLVPSDNKTVEHGDTLNPTLLSHSNGAIKVALANVTGDAAASELHDGCTKSTSNLSSVLTSMELSSGASVETQSNGSLRSSKMSRIQKYFRNAVLAMKLATKNKIFNPIEESSDEDEEVIGNQGIRLRSSRQARGRREFLQMKLVQEMKTEHTGAIWAMQFSPCGRLLATAGYDRNIRIWVLRQWHDFFKQMQQRMDSSTENTKFPSSTNFLKTDYLAVDPLDDESHLDSFSLASNSLSNSGKTDDGASSCSSAPDYPLLLNPQTKLSPVPNHHHLHHHRVADLHRGRRTVFGSKPLLVWRGHEGVVTDLTWSKNLFLLATSMDHHQVRLWHISRRECLCVFSHNDTVPTVVFHPKDDRYFLSGSLDGKLRLWNIPDKKVCFWVDVPIPSALPLFTSSHTSLLPINTGFGVSNLFQRSNLSIDLGLPMGSGSNPNQLTKTTGPKTVITCAVFACEGTKVVVGTYDGRVLFFNSELTYITFITMKSCSTKSYHCRVTAIECDPTDSNKILVTSNDSRLRLIDARDYHTLCKYRGFVNENSQIRASFSPTGRYLISGSENSFFYIWRKCLDFDRLSRFSRVRKDRNNCWEAIKAHDTMVTVALFCPNPNLILDKNLKRCKFFNTSAANASSSSLCCWSSSSCFKQGPLYQLRLDQLPPNADPDRSSGVYLGEVVVSADCNGCIRVFKKLSLDVTTQFTKKSSGS